MLAAAHSDPCEMELFRTTLSLISSEQENIPKRLKHYLVKIITQAQILSKEPTSINRKTLPEAIDLALEMRLHNKVSEQVVPLSDYASVTPVVARALLATMENCFASKKYYKTTP